MFPKHRQASPASHGLRGGFTLLEVILALAILAGAIAVLGEVMHLAGRAAADCQAESRAKILAATVMDKLASGMAEKRAVDREPLDTDDAVPWVYSVTFSDIDTDLEGLTAVEVVVEQELEKPFRPVKYRLMRWLPSAEEQASAAEASEADSSTNANTGTSAAGGDNA